MSKQKQQKAAELPKTVVHPVGFRPRACYTADQIADLTNVPLAEIEVAAAKAAFRTCADADGRPVHRGWSVLDWLAKRK